MTSPVIVQFGDCTVSCSYLLPHQRGDVKLQDALRRAYDDPGIQVCNEGLDGEATEDFLQRYERTLSRYPRLDLALIRYGVNDRKRSGLELFRDQLVTLCERLEQDRPGVNIVLETGIYVDYPKHYMFDRNSKLNPLYDIMRALAVERGYTLVDIYERMRRETEAGNWDLRARGFGSVDEENPILGPALDQLYAEDVRWFTNIHPNLQGVAAIVDEELSVLTRDFPATLNAQEMRRREVA